MVENKKIKLYLYFALLLLPAILSQIGGFDISEQENGRIYEEGSLYSRIFYPLLLVWLLYVIKTKTKTPLWTGYEIVLIAYLALGVFYSPTPIIVLRGMFIAITVLLMWNTIAKLIVDEYSLNILIETFIQFVVIYGSIEFVFWLADASRMNRYGEMGRYIGYFQQSNLFAKVISIGFMLSFFCLLSQNAIKKYWVSSIILLLFLFGSGSRTSLIAVVISISLVIIFTIKTKWKYIIPLLALCLLGYYMLNIIFPDFFGKVDNYSSTNVLEAGSFLWRINMWDMLLPEMQTHFLFGVGLNSFWTPSIMSDYGFASAGIHNGYLQVFEDLGILGLILVSLIHFPLIREIGKRNNLSDTTQIFRYFLISSWIYFLIVNVVEGDLGNYRSSLWGLLIVSSIIYSLHVHKRTTNIPITESSAISQ